jgi:hypothetical protein
MVRPVHVCTALLLGASLLAGCANVSQSIPSGALPQEEARAYLVFADQLRRVRNVFQKPVAVCLGANSFADLPLDRRVGPIAPAVLERLRAENDTAAIKLTIESSGECLPKAGTSDLVLVVAGQGLGSNSWMGDGNCRQFEGALYAPPLNRLVTYDFETRDGNLVLRGGEGCILGWYRE